jgi:hypothetical protein
MGGLGTKLILATTNNHPAIRLSISLPSMVIFEPSIFLRDLPCHKLRVTSMMRPLPSAAPLAPQSDDSPIQQADVLQQDYDWITDND